MRPPWVLAITGASGAIYAIRLLERLLSGGDEVHLTISQSGAVVLQQELGIAVDVNRFDIQQLTTRDPETPPNEMSRLIDSSLAALEASIEDNRGRLHYHHSGNFMAPIASGSSLTSGMVFSASNVMDLRASSGSAQSLPA